MNSYFCVGHVSSVGERLFKLFSCRRADGLQQLYNNNNDDNNNNNNIMEICKECTLRLKALIKQSGTDIMYMEMEMSARRPRT